MSRGMSDGPYDSRNASSGPRTTNGSQGFEEMINGTRKSPSSAGPSSATSSKPPSSFSYRTGTSASSPPSASPDGDGFLGVVARWGEDEEKANGGVRTSRMIGSKLGLSPPPPPGPPPSDPPPLPPASSHPFASQGASFSRSGALSRAAGRLSAVNAFRKAGAARPTTPPLHPPPDESALPIPTQSSQPLASSSPKPSHSRNASASSSKHSARFSMSPPNSPSLNGPTISPRQSSLFNPAQVVSSVGPSTALDAPIELRQSPEARPRSRSSRTPSRHLLQSALDLAQRAVEMDKNNDVAGALAAYREAVARLKNVMERVGVETRGDDPKRRRSTVGKSEEEGRTLRGIHDAYVARIQLLSTYENNDTLMPPSSMSTQHASASTSTLVPARSPRSNGSDPISEERTPRASFEDTGAMGIGNLMLNDAGNQSFDSSIASPPKPPVNGSPGRPPGPAPPSLAALQEEWSAGPNISGLAPGVPLHFDSLAPKSVIRKSSEDSTASTTASSIGQLIIPPPRRQSIGQSFNPSPVSRQSPQVGQSSRPGSRDGFVSPVTTRRLSGPTVGLEAALSMAVEEPEGMEELATTPSSAKLPAEATELLNGHGSDINRRPSGSFAQRPGGTRPLPPIPQSVQDGSGAPAIRARKGSLNTEAVPIDRNRPSSGSFLVSPSTMQGSISQRRHSRNDGSITATSDPTPSPILTDGLPMSSLPFPSAPQRSTSSSRSTPPLSASAFDPRSRTRSQPSSISRQSSQSEQEVPPLPSASLNTKPSFSSSVKQGLRINTENGGLAPPIGISSRSTTSTSRSLPPLPDTSTSGSLISPLPEAQPSEIIHRPFHLLRILHSSMDPESSGSYLTGAIHISSAVWKPSNWAKASSKSLAPPKITAQDVKVRCVEALLLHFEIIRQTGSALLDGPREGRYGTRAMVGGEPGRRMGLIVEEFCGVLDGLDEEMDQGYKALVKGGVSVNGWKGKKTGNSMSWGSRLSKTMDKMTNGKALDSPDRYVDLLSNLCAHAQIIDDHLHCFTGSCTPAYHTLPDQSYRQLESRITRAAEFVGAVIVPFVLDDFKQFFLRYLKGGVRYLED